MDIQVYLSRLIDGLTHTFGDRLLYVGLQGSYLRGEATETSDIDVMVIFDEIDASTLDTYRELLIAVGDYDRSCGFVCSSADMAAWNTPEVCHLLHTTRDLYGRLADFVPAYTREDVIQYVKVSVGNLYHELCHRYIHASRETNQSHLPMTCKAVFFILLNVHYLKTGSFVATKKELLEALEGDDREILALSLRLSEGEPLDFDNAFAGLLRWCQGTLTQWSQ
jgi:hypothetical protein